MGEFVLSDLRASRVSCSISGLRTFPVVPLFLIAL